MPESFVIEQKLPPPKLTVIPPPQENLPIDAHQNDVGNTIGLKITGGSDFNMPITIFHVKDDSKAKRAGLKLGDCIASIEGKSTADMTLKEAYEALLHACKNIRSFKIEIVPFSDDETVKITPVVQEIEIEGNPKAPKFYVEHQPEPPREAYHQHPERKAWHPIMWPHPEYFLPENYHEELPHKRIVRNVRKLLESRPSKLEIENLLLALPRGSRPKRNYDDDDE